MSAGSSKATGAGLTELLSDQVKSSAGTTNEWATPAAWWVSWPSLTRLSDIVGAGVLNGVVDSDRPDSDTFPGPAEEGTSALDAQEAQGARQNSRAQRQQETDQILSDAQQRDQDAEARDVVSDKREMVADLKAFLDRDETYAGLDERRASAVDRLHAKSDREASAQDRAELTKVDSESRSSDVPEDL